MMAFSLIACLTKLLSIPSRIILDVSERTVKRYLSDCLSIPSRIIIYTLCTVTLPAEFSFQFHQGLSERVHTRDMYYVFYLSIPSRIIFSHMIILFMPLHIFQFHQGLSKPRDASCNIQIRGFQFHQGLSGKKGGLNNCLRKSFQFHQGLSLHLQVFLPSRLMTFNSIKDYREPSRV